MEKETGLLVKNLTVWKNGKLLPQNIPSRMLRGKTLPLSTKPRQGYTKSSFSQLKVTFLGNHRQLQHNCTGGFTGSRLQSSFRLLPVLCVCGWRSHVATTTFHAGSPGPTTAASCAGTLCCWWEAWAHCLPTGLPGLTGPTTTLACTGIPVEERRFSFPSI